MNAVFAQEDKPPKRNGGEDRLAAKTDFHSPRGEGEVWFERHSLRSLKRGQAPNTPKYVLNSVLKYYIDSWATLRCAALVRAATRKGTPSLSGRPLFQNNSLNCFSIHPLRSALRMEISRSAERDQRLLASGLSPTFCKRLERKLLVLLILEIDWRRLWTGLRSRG